MSAGMRTAGILAIAAVAALTACGSGGGGSATLPSGDVLACQHFAQQGQKLKSEATPSLTDLALASGWVAEDAQLAVTPSLKAAFTQDSKAISDLLSSFGDTTAQQDAITKRGDYASAKIKAICARDGVTQLNGAAFFRDQSNLNYRIGARAIIICLESN